MLSPLLHLAGFIGDRVARLGQIGGPFAILVDGGGIGLARVEEIELEINIARGGIVHPADIPIRAGAISSLPLRLMEFCARCSLFGGVGDSHDLGAVFP